VKNANAEGHLTITGTVCVTNNWYGTIEEEKVEVHGKLTILNLVVETG